ncbi:MAG: 23S rRNA (guanosine(2251)-2'-O)-methyltransferase RlmB [Actinobacteria bacterium]|nr:23S rRNA (guanosine(2251)-2'-O)-methyltransferase RlmB [Actinomycetota bacterium]
MSAAGRTPKGAAESPVGHGHDVVYGRNPLREALRGRRRVHRVWVQTGKAGTDLTAEVHGWATEAGVSAPSLEVRSLEELGVLAASSDHQGVVAEVDAFPYTPEGEVLERFDLVLVLDRIQDPHNLGAIVRTAEVAGAAVVIPRHRTAVVTAAVVKASAGATEHAAVAQVRNLTDFLSDAKAAGFWVYGADASATTSHYDHDYQGKTVFVLGSEGEGLGRRVNQACDVVVRIPQAGRVGSLNVSVSAGVLLFEAHRQRAGKATASSDDQAGGDSGARGAGASGDEVPGGGVSGTLGGDAR